MSEPEQIVITVEETPKEDTLKFVVNRRIAGERSRSYFDAESSSRDPLASRLFAIDGVDAVLLIENAVMVTKTDEVAWPGLGDDVEAAIRDELSVEKSNPFQAALRSSGALGRMIGRSDDAETTGGEPRSPGAPREGRRIGQFRVRIPSDLRTIVTWLLVAAVVAQLPWLITASNLGRADPAFVRLGLTMAMLLLWVVGTEARE